MARLGRVENQMGSVFNMCTGFEVLGQPDKYNQHKKDVALRSGLKTIPWIQANALLRLVMQR